MIKEISIHDSNIKYNGKPIMDFIERGLKKNGITVLRNSTKCKHIIKWGWRNGEILRRQGHEVLIVERGYLGDRLSKWYSLGWNGLNGRSDFCLPKNLSFERFEKYFSLKPWKQGGDIIVIMGQIVGDMSLCGNNLTSWYENIALRLKKAQGMPVFFRPHPGATGARRNFKPDIPIIEGSLDNVFEQAFCVAAFNSNSLVDSVINGIPAISFDKGCMAWEVTSHDFNNIIRPDRTEWAAKIAHCQITPEEMEDGLWVLRFLDRET